MPWTVLQVSVGRDPGVQQAAGFKVVQHDRIAVQQHHQRPLATLHKVQAHAIDFQEAPLGWMLAFGAPRPQRHPGSSGGRAQRTRSQRKAHLLGPGPGREGGS